MSARLSDALATSLAALDLDDAHAAAVALAAAYAVELDGADARRARADRVAELVREQHGDESALYEEVEALRAALSARTALTSVGKLLHAILVELLATPKSRPARPAGRASSPLARLRAVQ